ncbi:MAG: 50S ribosomal protein L11 methyltransferase [Flavipsychrobacter sp.]
MQHIQTIIEVGESELRELLIARLSELGYEGFEENEQFLIAYIAEESYSKDAEAVLEEYNLSYKNQVIPKQNWNAVWEENFQPVIVDGFCTVRADFHEMQVETHYEIVITPKMSFGTGHHATTQLMMMQMQELPFKNARVLDFGTGTGILAILAEMLGASAVLAIDNDEWSFENAVENAIKNECTNVSVKQSSLEMVGDEPFDIILANINRHILLQYMEQLFQLLNTEGYLLMSGLLAEDKEIILQSATAAGFKEEKTTTQNNWMSILFTK